MATRVISQVIDLISPTEPAEEVISKYITDITEAGIQIHPEQWSEDTSTYIQIDGTGFSIFDKLKKIAEYGKDTIIGDKNDFHIEITSSYTYYVLSNDTVVEQNKTYYIKNNNDEYEEVQNPTGNPHTSNYYEQIVEPRLSFFRDEIHEVAYISGNKLYITQSVVLQQMNVGRKTGEIDSFTGEVGKGLWSWKVHEVNGSNNLYLKWFG